MFVLSNWEPRPDLKSWDWICDNVVTFRGEPFNGDDVPWCRGVCEAYDDKRTREIDLMWASRTAKTLISQSLTLFQQYSNPMPGIFASASERLSTRIIKSKYYPMLEHCPGLNEQLMPKHLRSVYFVRLRWSEQITVWSGSESQLADYSAFYIHCNEIDKWNTDKSSEADPIALVAERCKEYPDHKQIYESTPGLRGTSRIERKLKLSNNCRYQVPCPRCSHYQELVVGTGDPQAGGIIWDKLPDGKSDINLASRTARYVCAACHKEIHDEQRAVMMRKGVWVPEGQHVDKKGRLKGTPLREGDAWGSQLSSLYTLELRWGNIAAEFLKHVGRPTFRNFVNSWQGLTWEEHASKTLPEELGARLGTENPQGFVPAGGCFLTAGIDCQEGFFVFVVIAWGTGERGYLVDYGALDTWEEVEALLDRKYPHEDKKADMHISYSLVDSGAFTADVYAFCKRLSRPGRLVLPCKGSNHSLGGEPFKRSIIGDGVKKGTKTMRRAAMIARGQMRIDINVDYWECVIQKCFDDLKPGDAASLSFCREAVTDLDLCIQLLNGVKSGRKNQRNFDDPIWVKKSEEDPNDFRDAFRMARVAAQLKLRGRWAGLRREVFGSEQTTTTPNNTRQQKHPGENRPRLLDDRESSDRRGGFVRKMRRPLRRS